MNKQGAGTPEDINCEIWLQLAQTLNREKGFAELRKTSSVEHSDTFI